MDNTHGLSEGTRKAILINGLPASGKTYIGRALVDQFRAPLLTLDTIKEPMFNNLGIGDREYNRKLSKTCKEIIWALIADFPKDVLVILDVWFGFAPFDSVLEGLKHAGIGKFVEVWCTAPGDILAKRYLERINLRHKGHPGADYAPELAETAKRAVPMNLGPVYTIDSSDPSAINNDALFRWVSRELNIPYP
jgi:glucokinase